LSGCIGLASALAGKATRAPAFAHISPSSGILISSDPDFRYPYTS
jgi:hypothetical protein